MTNAAPNKAKRLPDLTPAQIELIARLYPDHTNSELAAQFNLPLYSVKNLATRLGLRKTSTHMQTTAKHSQFKTGHASWNKGKPHPSHPNAAKHQFKKGSRPHNWQPIGSIRNNDGYLERKTQNTGNTLRDYQAVHQLVWIENNGSVPKGHCIVFKDNNRRNFEPENLECISRQELMARNTIYNYPPDVISSIRALAGFKRKLRRVQNDLISQ